MSNEHVVAKLECRENINRQCVLAVINGKFIKQRDWLAKILFIMHILAASVAKWTIIQKPHLSFDMSNPWRITRRCFPSLRYFPITITIIYPICPLNHLPLCIDKCFN